MQRLFAPMLLTALSAVAPVLAQTPSPPQIVRGAVTAVTPAGLQIRARDGQTVTVALAKDWNVQVTEPVTADAIKAGSFIGTAEMPQANGSGRSIEVHVFPPGVKMGEGHYGWDLKKGSMMTNGTVGQVVAGHHGQEFDVSYSTGVRHIVVPAKTPIVQITGGDRSMVKPGVKVFLIALKTPAGALVTNGVAIGKAGAAPPM